MRRYCWVLCVVMVGAFGFGCSQAKLSSGEDQFAPSNEKLCWLEKMIDQGRFADTEDGLRKRMFQGDGTINQENAILLEIMWRTKRDYSLTREALVEKIRADIPDVTPLDVFSWTQQGYLQHRNIDGAVFYFRKEPSNLYRYCEEASNRRDANRPAEKKVDGFVLNDFLPRVIEAAEESGKVKVLPVKHRVTYKAKVKDGHPLVKKGAKVRCWLPYPQEYRQQSDVVLVSSSPGEPRIAPNGQPQRTAYFEKIIEDPNEPVEFSIVCDFTTCAYYPVLNAAHAVPYDKSSKLYKHYTAERRPHIEFGPEVRQIVDSLSEGEENPLELAKKIYYWVNDNLSYCSEMEYSTIRSLSAKALKTRRGDCGVQAMTFITLCRAAGIPARWQSGWESEPGTENMHDWSEFYVEPWGWLPADLSYGIREHSDPKVREFYFGHLDPFRMIVNLDYARQLCPPKDDFRSEPNDFQVGEIEVDGENLFYDEWDWDFDVTLDPEY